MDETIRRGASATRIGGSVWLWPVAAVLLAAWPVWRSFFAEDLNVGGLHLHGQILAAVAELMVVGGWVARYRARVTGYPLPLVTMGIALVVLLWATLNADAPVAGLGALAICWMAVVFLFAGAILLDGQRAFAARGGGAVPPASVLLRAHERVGWWLLAIALAVIAAMQPSPEGLLLAALAAVSPGAVMVWASLCDTARSLLARRHVFVADATILSTLVGRNEVVIGDPGMLVARRPKVISIMPVGEAKPGEIVGMAVALLGDDESDVAHGLQDFGVSHRLRVPNLKPLDAGAAVRRGRLPDRRTVEIGTINASALSEAQRAPFAAQLARAAELHRTVLALKEVEPSPQLLGLIVLAKAARPGASEALRTLRKAGFTCTLASTEIDHRDQEPLSALELKSVADWSAPVIALVPPGQPPLEPCAVAIHFGVRRRAADGEADGDILIARDDPRTLVDLLQFARDFRVRTRMAIIAANLPGIALLAAALGYGPASPLFVSVTALAGIALAVVTPQALRLSPTLANEVDEE